MGMPDGKEHLPKLIESLKSNLFEEIHFQNPKLRNQASRPLIIIFFSVEIRNLVKNHEVPNRDLIKVLEKKLEKCRNQENNPDSQMYLKSLHSSLPLICDIRN